MTPFSIGWREVLSSIVIFVLVLFAFALLSNFVGWPNSSGGWPIAVGVAIALALLRSLGPMLDFLQSTGAKVEAPFGLKIDFAGVARATIVVQPWVLSDSAVRTGPTVNESSIGELERSAEAFAHQPEIVIDLEDGQAWYTTRIFAVAATAVVIGSPKAIVFVGQKQAHPRQFGGWIKPVDAVRAFERHDGRFAKVHALALRYLAHLREHGEDSAYLGPPVVNNIQPLPSYGSYLHSFQTHGDMAIIRILVDQMRTTSAGETLEQPLHPPWITLGELELLLQAWLVHSHVDIGTPGKDQVLEILASRHDLLASTRNGQFVGIVDVRRMERDIIRQLVMRTPA